MESKNDQSDQHKSLTPKRANACDVLQIVLGTKKHVKVEGDSMNPIIYHGDIVIYKPISNRGFNFQQGDIVIAKLHETFRSILIINRIKEITPNGFDLRGENEDNSIDSRHHGLIPHNDIIGIVEKIISTDK